MIRLHEIKEILRAAYGKYTPYIDYVIKGFIGLLIYIIINMQLGFARSLTNPFIIILLSIFSSLLPWKFITLISIVMVMIHLNAISLWYLLLLGTLLLLMFLLYFHISIERGILLILVPIAFFLKIPYVLPVAAGLLGVPSDAIGIAFGIIFYNIIIFARGNLLSVPRNSDKELTQIVEGLSSVGNYLFKNPSLMLYIIVFSAVILIVYIIKRLSIRHSWFIAIFVGNVIMMIAFLLGDYKLEAPIKVVNLLVGIIISIIVNLIIAFFTFDVDYDATEHLQFEDDEYYYYVKAVPKISVPIGHRMIRRITDKKPNSIYKTDDIDPEKRNEW